MKKLFLFLIPLALISCLDNDDTKNELIIDPPTIPFPTSLYGFVKTNNNLGDQMLQKLCKDENNKNQNVTFSPYSMNMLLSMITSPVKIKIICFITLLCFLT